MLRLDGVDLAEVLYDFAPELMLELLLNVLRVYLAFAHHASLEILFGYNVRLYSLEIHILVSEVLLILVSANDIS